MYADLIEVVYIHISVQNPTNMSDSRTSLLATTSSVLCMAGSSTRTAGKNTFHGDLNQSVTINKASFSFIWLDIANGT